MTKYIKLSYLFILISTLFITLRDYFSIPLNSIIIFNFPCDSYLYILFLLFFSIILFSFTPIKLANYKFTLLNIFFSATWFLFSGSLVLSGFYHKITLLLFIPFSVLFYILTQKSNYDDFYEALGDGIILSFILVITFSILFRPLNTYLYYGGRYSGIFTNPNVFALYLLSPYCAILNKLHLKIKKTGWNFKYVKFQLIGLSICSSFIIMTQCRTALLATLITNISFLVLTSLNTINRFKTIIRGGFSILLAILISFPIVFYIIRYVPALVHNPIIYESEYTNIDDMITSGDPVDSKKYAKFQDFIDELLGRTSMKDKNLDSISTGRLDIYKAYFKQLSLKGHENIGLEIYKGKYALHSHDSYLQVAYNYGIIPGVIFILFSIISLWYSLKYYLYFSEKHDYSLFPFIVISTFIVASISEYLSSPFLPMGFLFLIVQAPLFNNELTLKFKYNFRKKIHKKNKSC